MSVEWAEPWRAIESADGLYLACGPVMRGGEGWANSTQSTDDDWSDGGEVVDGEVDEAEALPAGHAAMVLSFHMVYHPGYAVPVLFFEAANEAGGPMGLAELWPRLPLSRGVGAGADAEQIQLTYLALAEAPHLPGRAMLMLHPCETAAVLEAVVTDGSEAADEAAGLLDGTLGRERAIEGRVAVRLGEALLDDGAPSAEGGGEKARLCALADERSLGACSHGFDGGDWRAPDFCNVQNRQFLLRRISIRAARNRPRHYALCKLIFRASGPLLFS